MLVIIINFICKKINTVYNNYKNKREEEKLRQRIIDDILRRRGMLDD